MEREIIEAAREWASIYAADEDTVEALEPGMSSREAELLTRILRAVKAGQ